MQHEGTAHPIVGKLASTQTRRGFLRASAFATMSAPFLLTSRGAAAAGKLFYASYGGSNGEALDKIFFKPFSRETGIEVVQTPPVQLAKLRAAAAAGSIEWDIIEWQPAEIQAAASLGLLQPLDYSVIRADDIVFPASRKKFWYSKSFYTTGIGYGARTFEAGKHPTNWREFWDAKRFPGRRGLLSIPQDTLEIAVLAAGIAPENVYPIDVELAFATLKEIKPHIRKWTDTPPETIALIQNGELDFDYTYNGRVFAAAQAGSKVGFSKSQLMIFFSPSCVPTGAKNPRDAMRLLNYMMDSNRQAEYGRTMGFFPMSRRGLELASDELKDWIPDFRDPQNLLMADATLDWWGAPGRLEQLTERFKEFLFS